MKPDIPLALFNYYTIINWQTNIKSLGQQHRVCSSPVHLFNSLLYNTIQYVSKSDEIVAIMLCRIYIYELSGNIDWLWFRLHMCYGPSSKDPHPQQIQWVNQCMASPNTITDYLVMYFMCLSFISCSIYHLTS